MVWRWMLPIKSGTNLSMQCAEANQICLYVLECMAPCAVANRSACFMRCTPWSTGYWSIKVSQSRACGKATFITYLYSMWLRKIWNYILAKQCKLWCPELHSAHLGLPRRTVCSSVFLPKETMYFCYFLKKRENSNYVNYLQK